MLTDGGMLEETHARVHNDTIKCFYGNTMRMLCSRYKVHTANEKIPLMALGTFSTTVTVPEHAEVYSTVICIHITSELALMDARMLSDKSMSSKHRSGVMNHTPDQYNKPECESALGAGLAAARLFELVQHSHQ